MGLHFLTKPPDFLYMITRREEKHDRLPNYRVEILKEKIMTKDMDSISHPNTGQELKFAHIYTHPHPTIYSFLKSTSIKDTWN